MVLAEQRLLTEELKVDHLRLLMGTSMGCMHSYVWLERYPEFAQAAMPLACLPTEISGRNLAWRRVIIEAIQNDPAWQGGDYTAQPPSLRTAIGVLALVGGNPLTLAAVGTDTREGARVLQPGHRVTPAGHGRQRCDVRRRRLARLQPSA